MLPMKNSYLGNSDIFFEDFVSKVCKNLEDVKVSYKIAY